MHYNIHTPLDSSKYCYITSQLVIIVHNKHTQDNSTKFVDNTPAVLPPVSSGRSFSAN